MNDRPVLYYQTDSRWKNQDYSAKGEKTTIGASGCGPTSMAMVLATWADKSVTPLTECRWALQNGWKCPHSGTYYGYFVAAGKRYGLSVTRLNTASIYENSKASYHAEAKAALDRGDLVIACMGKGNWTSSGHYVLCWKISGDVIYINDPASSLARRTMGSYSLFKQQVKYYWVIKNPNKKKEDEPVGITKEEVMQLLEPIKADIEKLKKEGIPGGVIVNAVTDEEAYQMFAKGQRHAGKLAEPEWSEKEGHWKAMKEEGLMDGERPEAAVKRDELAAVLGRLIKLE